MVQANPEQVGGDGDGIVRHVQYAAYRQDKEAEEGHTRELICTRVAPEFYDDLGAQPLLQAGDKTLLECFQRHVTERGD